MFRGDSPRICGVSIRLWSYNDYSAAQIVRIFTNTSEIVRRRRNGTNISHFSGKHISQTIIPNIPVNLRSAVPTARARQNTLEFRRK